jgi:MFS family permease
MMELTLILIALCLAVFLATTDSVVITPAMPTIAKNLNASDAGLPGSVPLPSSPSRPRPLFGVK